MMRYLALFAAFSAAACSVPDAPPPPQVGVTPPVEWRTRLPGRAEVTPQWWQAFGDPVLTSLVGRALASNPDITTATARIREARAQERLARAQIFPTLDLGAGVTESRSLGALGTPVTATSAQPTFQTAYEVDLFGRIDDEIEAARAGTLSAEAASEAVRLSIAAATASGYITLRGLDARAALTEATIASRAEALRLARSRADVGYTSQLELRQAEGEYEAAAQLLPQIQLAIARQENALSLLAGELPQAIARGAALPELQQPAVPADLPSDLLRRRPDIAQAEFTLAASDATLDAARARFLPSLRLTGSAGLAISSALDDPVTIWSLGGSILAPLFQGGRLRAGVETAAARRDQAALAYQRTVLTAFREVEDALAAVDRLRDQRSHLEAQRLAAAEALRHAENRYRAGYSSYLEQLDAQRTLFSVEQSLVQVETDQLSALVALYQAVGGGWRPTDMASSQR